MGRSRCTRSKARWRSRVRGPMAARSARDHSHGGRRRSAGRVGPRRWRHLLRTGFLGTVRTLLAHRCTRGHHRSVALPHQGPSRARDARIDLLPDTGGARRDGAGLGRAPRRAEGGRRRHGQQPADAVAGRHPRRTGGEAVVSETTALGAAYAAGLAVGFWKTLDALRSNWKADRQWEPAWTPISARRLTRDGRRRSTRASGGPASRTLR